MPPVSSSARTAVRAAALAAFLSVQVQCNTDGGNGQYRREYGEHLLLLSQRPLSQALY